MALTYNNAVRDLTIECEIVLASADLNDVERIYLTAADVISYSGNGTIGSEGLPLGSAEAASYTLVIDNIRRDSNGEAVGKKYVPEIFDNAEVRARIGIEINGAISYSDFGVWYVNDSFAPEQGVTITLNGYDALASRFEAVFEDKYDYKNDKISVGYLARGACTAARIDLAKQEFVNATIHIDKKPSWEENTTLRQVLSYCAILAGGFVRMSRSGQVEIVSYSEGSTYALGPDLYQQFSSTGGSKFSFNAIEAMMKPDSDEYSRFAVDAETTDNATNTIQIDYNPLLTEARLNEAVDVLAAGGLSFEAGSLVWGGDPVVMCGDRYEITDLEGKTHVLLITQQSFQFDGGLNFSDTCTLPSVNTVNSPTFSTSTNMYDANGNLRVTHISAFGQSVINATTGHIGNLTADTIESDELFSKFISAINLLAGVIEARTLKAGSVETEQLAAGAVTAEKIASKTITADQIAAGAIDADAVKAVTAEVKKLTATDVEADTIGGALADFTVVTAGTANFDLETVKNLVSEALTLQAGSAGSMYITNLAVTSANILNATIGDLVIKGEDGRYYQVIVDSTGSIKTVEVTVSEGEIAAGKTATGKQIVEEVMNVQSLNAQNVFADSANIAELVTGLLNAGAITASQATLASATIPELYTTAVNALGNSMTFEANNTIQLLLGTQGEMKRWFTFDDEKGFTIRKPEYTDKNGTKHPASIWSTVTDETGYHIKRSDMAGYIGSFHKEQLDVKAIALGGVVCREMYGGGWLWTEE